MLLFVFACTYVFPIGDPRLVLSVPLGIVVATIIEWLLPIPDALGLGLFSVVGAAYAMESPDMSWFNASLFGVVTGAFGGVIGDVVCNRVPSIFRPSTPLYATASFIGSWAYILLSEANVLEGVAVAVAIAVVVLARLAALKWDISLPDLSHGADDNG